MSKNKFRLSFSPAMDHRGLQDVEFTRECESYRDALMVKNAIADYTLMLQERGLMTDYSNMAIIEMMHKGEWVEVDSKKDVDDLIIQTLTG